MKNKVLGALRGHTAISHKQLRYLLDEPDCLPFMNLLQGMVLAGEIEFAPDSPQNIYDGIFRLPAREAA